MQLDLNTKEVVYFLGFLWADGYIRHYTAKNGINNYKISLEINFEDAKVIQEILESFCNFSIHKRKRKENWKETWTFSKNNKELYQFLENNDYILKSTIEPTKIISLIPVNLINYFWKGLIDGDGSLGVSGKGSYLEIASTYDYKYTELDKWFNKFSLKGKIYKQVSKKGHKSSVYKIYGKKILQIEAGFPEYGLLRKNNKLKEIKKRYEK